MLSKVPEVTVWFWVIKILCTTVGESFADWINMTLGVGLQATAMIFTAVFVVVLAWQLRLDRYVPFVYWLTVVVVSVTGTLYTDILTDSLGVPLVLSTTVFAVLLGIVFGVWFVRERTLSIHSIVTLPRESFYWLAVLVTFALGTAAGDWTLELTGWSPGKSVLLPAALIVLIVIGWRLGANAVLSFWLAYILTRPLGANLGDWFASPKTDGGLGLGTAVTSVIFLTAILATVVYLTLTRSDVIEEYDRTHTPIVTTNPTRERILLGYFLAVAVATVALLVWAAGRPHATAAARGRGFRPGRQLEPVGGTAGPGRRDRRPRTSHRLMSRVPQHRRGHAREGPGRRPGRREGADQGSGIGLGRRRGHPAAHGRRTPGLVSTGRSTVPDGVAGGQSRPRRRDPESQRSADR